MMTSEEGTKEFIKHVKENIPCVMNKRMHVYMQNHVKNVVWQNNAL